MKKRIDFQISGNQKCGTNALHNLLDQHPAVRMSSPKELHFFDAKNYRCDESAFQTYHRDGWGLGNGGLESAFLYGESTPKYVLLGPGGEARFLGRIQEYNPDIKHIVLFRDPVERAYSQWNMLRHNGRPVVDFETVVEVGTSAKSPQSSSFNIISRGHYGQICQNLLSLFGPERCCFIRVTDLNHQMNEVTDFLGIAPMNYETRYSYVLPYTSAMSEEARKTLRSYYGPEMVRFGELTGIDAADWIDR